uniref:Cnidarian restricted protein n=1 Tax=Clytia hemisphaerica TaxID=252671 RepID=A0A7M5VDK5_9CNID
MQKPSSETPLLISIFAMLATLDIVASLAGPLQHGNGQSGKTVVIQTTQPRITTPKTILSSFEKLCANQPEWCRKRMLNNKLRMKHSSDQRSRRHLLTSQYILSHKRRTQSSSTVDRKPQRNINQKLQRLATMQRTYDYIRESNKIIKRLQKFVKKEFS